VSSLDQFTAAFESLRQAAQAGRLAHAYLIAGTPRGSGRVFAESMLKLVFCSGAEKPCGVCDGCRRVEERRHPDVVWIEPEKKSRIIGIAQIRDLNQRLSQTAFAGGWKAGVLLYADRMEDPSANAFLKTLEEPPGQCLLLLVTEQPQGILPTIVSRCQRVGLGEKGTEPEASWRPELLRLLRESRTDTTLDRLALAGELKRILDTIKKQLTEVEEREAGLSAEDDDDEAEEEEEDEDDDAVSRDVVLARVEAKLRKERSDVMKTILLWHRDLLACRMGAPDEALTYPAEAAILRAKTAGLTYAQGLANLRAIEGAIRLLDRNLPDITALESALLESSWP
jgi:DNA polymerase-3 subunit delta'